MTWENVGQIAVLMLLAYVLIAALLSAHREGRRRPHPRRRED